MSLASHRPTVSVGSGGISSLTALTPTAFLRRAALGFRDRIAVVDGARRFTYEQLDDRAARVAGALSAIGVEPGERVAALCTNSHVMLELHNGVPFAGSALVPLNTRLSRGELEFMVTHSEARVLVATEDLADLASAVASSTGCQLVVEGDAYESLLAAAEPKREPCHDERSLLAVSYTSGSTGRPKGVMYSPRGAYLQALAMAYHHAFECDSVYLWTLPMFHCNGWACTWAVTAAGGTHSCMRKFDPNEVWRAICEDGVTHFSGAPTVLTMLAEAAESLPNLRPTSPILASTGGAPPPPVLLERLAAMNIRVMHLYGLTETYGPAVVNQWQARWSQETSDAQSSLNARQGIGNIVTGELTVLDDDGHPVPEDGETLGEIALRGNNVMLGYYKDETATESATRNGFFLTGDLGVRHADGYIELRDRAKDIIISGGENIASVEIERILVTHPDVLEAAVVARPDARWQEVPVAFVHPRAGATPDADDLIAFVRARTAAFKAPKAVFFTDLPKTSTGKVEKHRLRAQFDVE